MFEHFARQLDRLLYIRVRLAGSADADAHDHVLVEDVERRGAAAFGQVGLLAEAGHAARARRLLPVLLLLLLVAALAQGEKKSVKVTGYVIDNMCAGMHGSEEEASNHPNACALMPACEKSGLAVVSGDKVYKLDEQGNKLAAEALKAAKTRKGLKVNVEGTLEGDTLHATSLAEAK